MRAAWVAWAIVEGVEIIPVLIVLTRLWVPKRTINQPAYPFAKWAYALPGAIVMCQGHRRVSVFSFGLGCW
jgi:hypothetical protein